MLKKLIIIISSTIDVDLPTKALNIYITRRYILVTNNIIDDYRSMMGIIIKMKKY